MRILTASIVTVAVSGCFLYGGAHPAPVVVRADTSRSSQTIPVESMVEQRSPDAPNPEVGTPPPAERLVSITAVNADVRPLLIGIAREAGIDLVVTSDVNRRVSINLKDVPATQAIAAIAAAAELTLGLPRQRDLPAVVYYQLPVDINKESAATIAARFGVSLELARFIVESRP